MHRGKCGDGEPRRAGIPALGKAESAPGVCRAVTLSLALRKDSSCGPVASPQPAKPRLPSERAVAAIPHPVPERDLSRAKFLTFLPRGECCVRQFLSLIARLF